MITEEAVDLLRRVQKALREQPDHFDMDYWFRDWSNPGSDPDDGWGEVDTWGRLVLSDPAVVPEDEPLAKKLTPSCGTTACIAGWIVAAAGERVTPGVTIQQEAQRLIGWVDDLSVEPWIRNCPLFHVGRWPTDLRDRYCHEDDTGTRRSEAACEAIDRWIEADGVAVLF